MYTYVYIYIERDLKKKKKKIKKNKKIKKIKTNKKNKNLQSLIIVLLGSIILLFCYTFKIYLFPMTYAIIFIFPNCSSPSSTTSFYQQHTQAT